MDLLKALTDLPPSLKLVLGVISAHLATWLAWIQVQKGSFSLSQARTERLYQLMLRQDVSEVPSGALTMAVKEAMNVELGGDWVRFALEYDNPLFVLRAFKSTLGDVKMSPDGKMCLDARSNPWLSLQTKRNVYIGMLLAAYAFLVVTVFVATFGLKRAPAPWLGYVFLGIFAAVPYLLWKALRIDMVRKLVAPGPGEMRRPASSLTRTHEPSAGNGGIASLAETPTPPKEARAMESGKKREEEGGATKEVAHAIEKVLDAVKSGGERSSEETPAPSD